MLYIWRQCGRSCGLACWHVAHWQSDIYATMRDGGSEAHAHFIKAWMSNSGTGIFFSALWSLNNKCFWLSLPHWHSLGGTVISHFAAARGKRIDMLTLPLGSYANSIRLYFLRANPYVPKCFFFYTVHHWIIWWACSRMKHMMHALLNSTKQRLQLSSRNLVHRTSIGAVHVRQSTQGCSESPSNRKRNSIGCSGSNSNGYSNTEDRSSIQTLCHGSGAGWQVLL